MVALHRGYAIARRVGDLQLATFYHHYTGVHSFFSGDAEQALAFLEIALRGFRELGKRRFEVVSLDTMGVVFKQLDQHEQALRHWNRARSILKTIGGRTEEGNLRINMGTLQRKLGLYTEADENLRFGASVGEEYGLAHLVGEAQMQLGLLALEQGEEERGEALLDSGAGSLRATGMWMELGEALGEHITILLDRGQPQRAREKLGALGDIAEKLGSKSPVGQLHATLTARLTELTASHEIPPKTP